MSSRSNRSQSPPSIPEGAEIAVVSYASAFPRRWPYLLRRMIDLLVHPSGLVERGRR